MSSRGRGDTCSRRSTPGHRLAGPQRFAATLTAATIIGLITVDIIDLGMQHVGEASHRTHDVAYGALFTTLVVGVVVQLRRPERKVAGMVMALIPSGSLLLAGGLVDDIDRVFAFNPLRYAAANAAVVALLHPSGRRFFRSFRLSSVGWSLMALLAVAAVPLLRFAATSIRVQRDLTDSHAFMGHYGFMAALAFTIVGVGVLAAIRPVGWRLTAWVSALLFAALALRLDDAADVASGPQPATRRHPSRWLTPPRETAKHDDRALCYMLS